MAIDRRKSAAKRFEDDRKKKAAAAAKKAEQEKKAAAAKKAEKSQKQNKPVRSPGKDITTSVRDTFRGQAAKPQFGREQTAAQRMQGRSENWARLETQKAGADKSTRKKIEAAQDRLHKANRKDAKGMTFDSATGRWEKGGKPAYTPNVLPGMSRDAQRTGMERSLRNGIVAPDMQKAAKKHQDAVWDRVHGPETGERFGLGLESVGKSVKGFLPALGETLAQDARNARTDWNNPKLKVLVREASRLQRELNVRGLPTGGETRKEKAQRLQDLLRQIDEMRDKTAVDQNQYGQRMMRESAEAAQEATRGLSGATKFAADTALGIAGNAPALALSAVPVVGQGLSLGMMGGQAAAQKTAQLNARGIAPGEALARGVAAGGIEALTEKLPLDELVKVAKTGGRGAVKNILKQMGMEATEESVSYALNYAADKIAGDPEAQFTLRELAGNALGGAVSGGILSGGATAVNRARNLPKTPLPLPVKTQETANTLPQDIQNEIKNPESAVVDVKMQEPETQTKPEAQMTMDELLNTAQETDADYRAQIDGVFDGSLPTDRQIIIGQTPDTLRSLGAPDLPITMTQSTARKIAYPAGYMGGKHNLGIPALKSLPEQLNDPLAVIQSKTQPDSFVVLTEWNDTSGNPVVAAIHMNKRGVIEDVNTLASAYGKRNLEALLGQAHENVIYTKENKSIDQILDNRLRLPELLSDDTLVAHSIAQNAGENNPQSGETVLQAAEKKPEIRTMSGTPNYEITGYTLSEDAVNLGNALAESGNPQQALTEIIEAYEPAYQKAIAAAADYIRQYQPQGTVVLNADDYGRGGYRASQNEQWYRAFYQKNGHAPRNADIPALAEQMVHADADGTQFGFPAQSVKVLEAAKELQERVVTRDGFTGFTQNADGDVQALYDMQPQDVGQVAADATTGAAPSGFDPYTHAANEYRTIQPGENPARIVDVPKSMDGEDRVRRFARTTMEAQATPDEMIPLFEEGVTEGLFSYHPRKNADDLANALGFIERNGAEFSIKAWDEKMKGGTVNTDDLIRAQILYKLAAQAGDTQTAMRLAGQIAAEYTKAGQMVQSARLLKKATPEGKYAFIQRSVQNLQEQLNKKRGKDAPQITINEQLAQNVLDAKDTAELDTASEALYQDIAKQIPGTWVDKVNAWRYLAMLGNPRTHIRNLVGNVMFSVPVGVKNKVGAALERVFVKEGQRTKTLAPADKAAREFAKADAQEMMDVLKDGGKYNPTDIIRQYQDPFSPKNLLGRTLNKASNWNSNALDAEDGIFLGYHYRNALAGYMKANGFTPEQLRNELGEATPELEKARTYAIREAQKATFRDASKIADVLSKAEQTNAASRLVLGGFIPFKKTPVNILKRGVEYGPAGIIKGIKEAAVDLRQGTKTPAEVIDSFASGITGTALMALGAFLAKEGWLTGADAEERKEQFLDDAEGLQSYALNLGDYTYTVDWSAPASLPLFMGVELWNALDNGAGGDSGSKLDAFVTALQNITEPIFNLTMMDGVQGAIQSATYSEGNKVTAMAGNTVSDYFGQFVPTLMGQVARTVDDTRRTTYKGNKITGLSSLDQWIQRQQNKIPGVSKKNAPYMDVFGQTDTEPNTALRAFENFLSPGYISRKKENGAIDGLRALYETTGESSALPSRADTSFRVDGEEVKLSQDEYVKFVQKRGKTMQDSLDVLFGSKSYQDMSDADKLAAVQKVFQYATAAAKTGVSAYKMDSDQERARDSGVSPGLWYGYQQQMSAREAAEQEKYTYMPEIIDKIMNEETLDDGKRQKFVQSLVIDGISDKQKDLYAAAKNDVPADVWAKTYYKFREIEETLNGTGSEKNEAKRAYLFADQGLSGKQKSILDEAMIQDALYIPKDVVVDYSSPESFVLTQMSNAAQEKFSRFGMPVQDYAKYYPIASQGGKKKAEVLEELRAAGMSAGEAESFYKTLKSKNGSSSGKSSKGKSSGGGNSGKGKTGPRLPSKPRAPKLRLP